MESLNQFQILSGHSERVWYVSWNPEGDILASCSADKTIKLWAYSTTTEFWTCVYTISNQHKRTVRRVEWSSCGKLLASAGFDGITYIWNVDFSNNKVVSIDLLDDLDSHNYEVKAVSFSTSGRFLATCARDKTVQFWDIDEDGPSFLCSSIVQSHSEDVKCLCWHPWEEILVSGSYDNTIKVYKEDSVDWEVIATLVGHQSTVWQVAFNNSGDILASCSDDGTVRLWVCLDAGYSKWVCATTMEGYHQGVIYDISWLSPSILASVSEDNSVCVYRVGDSAKMVSGDVGSGVDVEMLARVAGAHEEDINCCAWNRNNPQSMILATGSDDCTIKLWKFSDPDLPID